MKTRAAVIVLLVAACAFAWWANVFAGADVPPALPVPASTDGAPADATERGEVAAVPTPERNTVASHARVRRVRVTTVNARGDVVEGAEVRYWPPGSRGERADARRLAGTDDVEALLRAGGRSAVSDMRGVVEIEADERSSVCARKGDAYGQAMLGGADTRWADELRLELQHDVTVAAEVVDGDGRPIADCPVVVDSHFVSPQGGDGARATAFTGSDGVAMFAHVLQALAWPADAARGQLRFCCEVLGSNNVVLAEQTVPFDPLHPPERVRLVVPSSGTVVVTAKDADGKTLEPECWLEDGRGDFRQAVQVGERSLFQQVPFGVRWTLVLRGGTYRHQRAVDGPDAGNPVVRLAMTVPMRAVELRARVVRPGGEPVAGAKIVWRCQALGDHATETVTDEHGTIPFGRLFLQASREQEKGIEVAVSSPHIVPRTFTFDRRIARGTTDLGDLVAQPPAGETLLVSVELRCDGAPVHEGGWALLRAQADLSKGAAVLSHGDASDQSSSPVARPAMQYGVATFTRRVGDVIELRGAVPEGQLVLHCGHPDCVTVQDLDVVLGEHKIVELQRAATLRVSVLPPDVPRARIRGTLTRFGERSGKAKVFDVAQQRLTFDDLVPGGYSLRIAVGGCVLYETSAIALTAGDNRWPSDGSALDLRNAARMIAIDARDASTGGQIAVEVADVPAGSMAALERRGRDVFDPRRGGGMDGTREQWHPLSARPVDLLVRSPGYVPVRVVGPRQDVEVRLTRSTSLELDFGEDASAKVRVRIVDDALRDEALRSFDDFNMHQSEAEFLVDGRWNHIPQFVPGTVVELSLMRDGTPGTPQRVTIGTTSPQKVTLR